MFLRELNRLRSLRSWTERRDKILFRGLLLKNNIYTVEPL